MKINTLKAFTLIILQWISLLGTSLALVTLAGADNFILRCFLIWPFSMAAFHTTIIIWRHFKTLTAKQKRLARLNNQPNQPM